MLPSYRILGIGAMRCHHLVESAYAVTRLELVDIFADLIDYARDIVP